MSERRACCVIDADRESVRYRSTRDDDAGLREQLCEPINQRRRFGYRRLVILLLREGDDQPEEDAAESVLSGPERRHRSWRCRTHGGGLPRRQ